MHTITNYVALGASVISVFMGYEMPFGPDCSGTRRFELRVQHGDNQQGCSVCQGMMLNNWALHHQCDKTGPYRPATERWTITNMVMVETFTITRQAPGGILTNRFTSETVLSSVTNREVLASYWTNPTITNVVTTLTDETLTNLLNMRGILMTIGGTNDPSIFLGVKTNSIRR